LKALSVKQPYAGRIARGEKTIEVRGWSTSYRGRILVCSSKQPAEETDEPCGVMICIVTLVDVRAFKRSDVEAAMCDWSPNLYAFVLADVRPVEPIAIRGALGLFEVRYPPAGKAGDSLF
jgi:hypothetical protein